MSMLADHVAALILNLAGKRRNTTGYFLSDLKAAVDDQFELVVPEHLVEAAVVRLIEVGGVTMLPSPLTGTFYRIDPVKALRWFDDDAEPTEQSPIEYDREWERAQSEFGILKTYYHGGQTWIDRVVEALKNRDLTTEEDVAAASGDQNDVPASDRIVSLSHNQIGDLDASATEVIEAAEITDFETEADKSLMLGQLRAGRELIRAGTFRLYFLQISLIQALERLAKRYEKELVGALAAQLLAALVSHLSNA